MVYGAEDASVRGVPFDIETLEITGNPVPLLEDISVKNSGAANFSVSDAGELVFAIGDGGDIGQTTLVWVNRNGEEEPLNIGPNTYFFPRISPDGRHIATTIGASENIDVWISEVARGTLTNLTTSPANDLNPLWTRDGARVVFVSNRDGQDGVFSRLADGTGPVDLLFSEQSRFIRPSDWSLDGNTLFYSYAGGDEGGSVTSDIGALAQDGSWEQLLDSGANEGAPAISPDGHWIAYHSDQTGRFEVYVERFPELGQRMQISTTGGRVPRWSANGAELFYRATSANEAVMTVPIELEPTFRPGAPELLFEGNYRGGTVGGSFHNRHYDVTTDGDRFLMIRLDGGLSQSDGDTPLPITVVLNWFEELKERVPIF